MGFADLFGSLSNIYNSVRTGVSEIYDMGKKVTGFVARGMNWVDEQLDSLASIPFVGEIIEEGLEEARDFQFMGVSWNKLKRGANKLDEFLDHSEIVSIVNQLDTAITSALEAGQTYGGEVDQFFAGGAQPMGGVQV
jgi:hypothetical protein